MLFNFCANNIIENENEDDASSISYRYFRKTLNIIFSYFQKNATEKIKNNASLFTVYCFQTYYQKQ